MGLFFRKSKNVGPFRLNFSKSGVGVSTGVKGARVSFGPRGTYINMGANGIYYRKKIGGKAKQTVNRSKGNNNYYKQINNGNYERINNNYSNAINNICIPLTDGNNMELSKNIKNDIFLSKLCWFLFLLASLIILYYVGPWSIYLILLFAIFCYKKFAAKIEYDLDEKTIGEWNLFIEAFSCLSKCKKMWLIESTKSVNNVKVNAGASSVINRSIASSKVLAPNAVVNFIKTKVKRGSINSSKCNIYFFPNYVVIKRGKLLFYSYENISISYAHSVFIEDYVAPSDAKVIGYTWQYVNKDGSPDRRYKDNKRKIRCQYGKIVFRSNDGLNVEFQCSSADKARMFVDSVSQYKQKLKYYNMLSNRQVVDTKTDTKIDTKADTKIDAKTDTKTDTKIDAPIYSSVNKFQPAKSNNSNNTLMDEFNEFINPEDIS